jgi:hypothetical protein
MLGRSRFSFLDEAVGLFTGARGFTAPEGYEDETGFHFEERSAGTSGRTFDADNRDRSSVPCDLVRNGARGED